MLMNRKCSVLLIAALAILVVAPQCAAVAVGSEVEGGGDPALYVASSYLTKAATKAMPSMNRSLFHVEVPMGANVSFHEECVISHDDVTLLSGGFDSVIVAPVNATHVAVTVEGVTPLVSTKRHFELGCTFAGRAFDGSLNLGQTGHFVATTSFPGSSIRYLASVVVTNGRAGLSSSELLSQATTTIAYQYDQQGFPLDPLVAGYFGDQLAPRVADAFTQAVSSSSAFSKAWHSAVSDALSVSEHVCGTATTDGGLPGKVLALWMQPGCSPPPFSPEFDLLQSHDLLVVLPSTSGLDRSKKDLMSGGVAALKSSDSSKTTSSQPPDCVALPNCAFKAHTTGRMNVTLDNCVVCYPLGGKYTTLAVLATLFDGI